MTARRSDLEAEIDELYGLPLGRFTTERNALATRLRQGEERDAADRIQSLAKPSAAAWVVNRLYRDDRKTYDHLMRIGGRLAAAQQRGGDTMKALSAERRQLLASLLERARALMDAARMSANRALLKRIEITLEALSVSASDEPAGRLTRELEAPGFDALLALGIRLVPVKPIERARGGKPRAAKTPSRRDARAEKARARVESAERELGKCRIKADTARIAREAAEEETRASRVEVETATRRLATARGRARRAASTLKRARDAERRSRAAMKSAERELETARRARKRRPEG